jgi:hypothetical protein
MSSYSATNVIQLPRLAAAGAVALGEQLLTAAKPHKSALPAPLTKSLGVLRTSHGGLQKALSGQVRPPSETSAETVLADRDVDACWSGLHDFLTGLAKLPRVKEAKTAAEIKANVFPDGLRFIQLPYELQWAEGDARLKRIAKQALDQKIVALGGKLFLDELKKAQHAYGKVLGIKKVKAPAPEAPPSVRDALDAFSTALRKYVAKVIASVEDDEPETQELADALLGPLAAWDVGPVNGKAKSGKKTQEEEPSEEEPVGAPKAAEAPTAEASASEVPAGEAKAAGGGGAAATKAVKKQG